MFFMNDVELEQSFIGKGFAYTLNDGLGMNQTGGVGLMSGEQDVAKSIFIILSTAPGERVMRPEFGCEIHSMLFASPGPQTFGLIAYYIQQALGRWEPRIDVQEIIPQINPDKPSELLIDIRYKLRQTNSDRNLVYPFYIIPREQE
jgi:phage baseplate assembly protein W